VEVLEVILTLVHKTWIPLLYLQHIFIGHHFNNNIIDFMGSVEWLHRLLLFIQNLLEKAEERETVHENAVAMVTCKVLKQLELLEARKYDDPDIMDDLAFLQEKLQASVQDLRWVAYPVKSFYFVGGCLSLWIFNLKKIPWIFDRCTKHAWILDNCKNVKSYSIYQF